jgi:hypothetical protein
MAPPRLCSPSCAQAGSPSAMPPLPMIYGKGDASIYYLEKPSKPVDDRRLADRQGFQGETSPWSQGAAVAVPEKGRQGAQLPLEGGNAKRVPPPKRFRG